MHIPYKMASTHSPTTVRNQRSKGIVSWILQPSDTMKGFEALVVASCTFVLCMDMTSKHFHVEGVTMAGSWFNLRISERKLQHQMRTKMERKAATTETFLSSNFREVLKKLKRAKRLRFSEKSLNQMRPSDWLTNSWSVSHNGIKFLYAWYTQMKTKNAQFSECGCAVLSWFVFYLRIFTLQGRDSWYKRWTTISDVLKR